MHLFYNASQIIKMVILVYLSAIFLASPLTILAWELANSCLSKVAQSFSGTQSICCSHTSVTQNVPIPYWVTHAKVLRANTSFQISPTTCLTLEKLWLPSLHSESNLFRRFFFLPRLIRPPGNMPTKLSLVSTWRITNVQNYYFKSTNSTFREN